MLEYKSLIHAYHASYTALYDNSDAFSNYLHSQGLVPELQHNKLQLKNNNTIVPHVGQVSDTN